MSETSENRAHRRPLLIPVVTFLLVAAAMVWQGLTPEAAFPAPPDVAFGEIEGFSSAALAPTEAELKTLPRDTAFVKRTYERADGSQYLVTAIVGGRSKSSIHRPELCLPAQGFQMSAPHDADVAGPWRMLELGQGTGTASFAYTFFNQAGCRTAQHFRRILTDVVDRSLFNRIDRWVMVTVTAPCGEAGLRNFIAKLVEVSPCLK